MMTILSSSSWNTFLDCARLLLLDEDSTSSPILNMEKPHLGTSSHIHSFKYMASFKHIVSSRCPSWTCTLSWSTLYLFFSLHDDVLKVNMTTHSIFSFFKTCLQSAQLSHDHSLDLPWISPWSTLDLLCFNLLFTLKPTYGLQALPMDKTFKYNSMQTLVHRDCH